MSLRIAALGLLAEYPGSGYDLLKRFEHSMANVWPATQSQLYGELNKLADGGLIEVSDIGPRGRKEYRVTPAGRRRPDVLRVFLLGEVPADVAREYVTTFAERAASDLKRYEHLRDSVHWQDDDGGDFYGRAALEYGIQNAAMEERWAHWLINAIDERTQE